MALLTSSVTKEGLVARLSAGPMRLLGSGQRLARQWQTPVPGPQGRASGAVPADPPATDVRVPGSDAGGAIAGTVTEGVCPLHVLVGRRPLQFPTVPVDLLWKVPRRSAAAPHGWGD